MPFRWPRPPGWLLLLSATFLLFAWRTSPFTAANVRHDEATTYCETLVPLIEDYYTKMGYYPFPLPKDWLDATAPPDLIRPDFYLQTESGQGYLLRFRDPDSCFFWQVSCNDVYGFHGGRKWGGRWLNYDGY